MSKRYWWESYGPFDPDPNDEDFPNAGQVVRHYRLLKKWTPAQLGVAMEKTARWVQAMEHDNTVPEAISRRRALAKILDIPPVLLGLAVIEDITAPQATSIPKKTNVDNRVITQFQNSLKLYWELYYTSTTYDSLEEIINGTRHLKGLIPDASSHQKAQLTELLSQYHQLIAHTLRDQEDYDTAFVYANRAIKIAKETENNELIASALLRRGFISFNRGRNISGQKDIANAVADLDAALPFAAHARTPLKGFIMQIAGHYRTYTIQDHTDATQALKLLDQAGNILRQGRLEDDQSFVQFSPGWYHQERAWALITMKKPADALDELDLAERLLGPDQPRRRAQIIILQAKAYLIKGQFDATIDLAEDALKISKAVKSEDAISQIAKLHEQLHGSKYGNSPEVARLGRMLTSP